MDFEELICSECGLFFDTEERVPRMIPSCGHTFCSECISEIVQTQSTNSEHLFCCPDDQFTTKLANQDVSNFPINFLLSRLVEKRTVFLSNMPSRAISRAISKDETISNDIITRNPSNMLFVSNEGGSPQNSDTANTGRNQRLSIGSEPMNICLEHGRLFEIVCLDDKCRICSNCALFGAHRNHNIKAEGEVLKDIATIAEHLIDLFQTIQKQERTILDGEVFECLQIQLKEKQSDLTKTVQEKFKEFHDLLKAQERIALVELEQRFTNIREKLFEVKQIPGDVQEKLNKWKVRTEEALTIISERTEQGEIVFELLDAMNNNQDNILFIGENLISDLKNSKDTLLRAFENETKISVTFNDNFKKTLEMLCQVSALDSSESTMVPIGSPKGSSSLSFSNKYLTPIKNEVKITVTEDTYNTSFGSSGNMRISMPIERARPASSQEYFQSEVNYKEQDPIFSKQEEVVLASSAALNTSENKRLHDDTDLLNFEINDLTLGEIFETDYTIKVLSPGLRTKVDFSTREKRGMHLRHKNSDLEVLETLKSLTDNQVSPRPSVSSKSPMNSGRNNDTYARVYRDTVRTPRRSISPFQRDASADTLARAGKAKKKIDINVSDKYEAIIEGIKYRTLESADLTAADLGDQGIYKLADYLKDNHKLKSLKLLKNKITDCGGLALVNALYYNKSLQVLNLTQNHLTEKTVDAFVELFRTHKSLKTIYFNQNSISLRNIKAKIKEMTTMGINVSI